MKPRFLVLLLLPALLAADALRSGPPVSSKKLPPFNPLHVTGPQAGSRASPIVRHGPGPVVMVFARGTGDDVVRLVKALDAATARHAPAKLGSFVVFLGDEKELEGRLKDLARREKLTQTALTISPRKDGPKGYDLHPQAEVTAVLYVDRTVKANHAFRKGELTEKAVAQVLADLPKILPR